MTIDPFSLDEAPYGEPLSLTIGQSAMWRREINIDGSLFDIKYVLRDYAPGQGHAQGYEIPMTQVSSGVFGADVVPEDIATWHEGHYFWDLRVVRKSDARTATIEVGEIRVFNGNDERRSHAQVMLTKIESILQNRADNDVASYSIKSRSITKMSASELRDWREYYLREINNTPRSEGIFTKKKPNASTIKLRFTD